MEASDAFARVGGVTNLHPVGAELLAEVSELDFAQRLLERMEGEPAALHQPSDLADLVTAFCRSMSQGDGLPYFREATSHGLVFQRERAFRNLESKREWNIIIDTPDQGRRVLEVPSPDATDEAVYQRLWDACYSIDISRITAWDPEPRVIERSLHDAGADWRFEGVRGGTTLFLPPGQPDEAVAAKELDGTDRAAAVEFDIQLADGSRGRLRTLWCFHPTANRWIPIAAFCAIEPGAPMWPWPSN